MTGEIAIWALVIVAVAVATAVVAAAKDRNAAGWFVLGLLFSVFAFVVIAVLPTRRPTQVVAAAASGAARGEPARVPCPHCAEMILPEAKKCRFCGEAVQPSAAPARKVRYVQCPNCRRSTAEGATCDLCGEPMPTARIF